MSFWKSNSLLWIKIRITFLVIITVVFGIVMFVAIKNDIREQKCREKEDRILDRMTAVATWPEPKATEMTNYYIEKYWQLQEGCNND